LSDINGLVWSKRRRKLE